MACQGRVRESGARTNAALHNRLAWSIMTEREIYLAVRVMIGACDEGECWVVQVRGKGSGRGRDRGKAMTPPFLSVHPTWVPVTLILFHPQTCSHPVGLLRCSDWL